ncbi:MATE family efflux transporter [Alkaliphilus peptidifermentans]|uniref:Probable multidrug resistance protein NorM n=1 Tax=Alkaliphilus peptidifermentans DSM 18978 TaxID=1120976 RepID=A0A1G5KQ25_9FIRM|nr:MATE family efflux transporter [Alkaliphilus peptidifermentans]SCZ02208.1 putative efflux protein, MATE family [Alkaliphilus peptidifermentans DSM 18978]
MIQKKIDDKIFYKIMASIALPIALQNLISSSLNAVDTVMIGKLGAVEIAAVGLANQFFFVFVLILFGINSGVSIFTAQYWGKKDIDNIQRVLGLALMLGIGFSLTFFLAAFLFPQWILKIFTEDQTVIHLGSSYLRIVSVSYIFTAISFSYSFAMRSTGNAKLTMVVSAISLLANTLLNYILIFGAGAIPAMGIKGAAIATLISRTLETLLIVSYVYSYYDVLAVRSLRIFKISSSFFKQVMNTTTPVILNEAFWALGMSMYSISYARISTEAVASVQIALTIQGIFIVIGMGLGNASAVMIGNVIGANEEERAINYAKRFSILGTATGAIIGLIMMVAAPLVLNFFNVSDAVSHNAINILRVFALFMAFKFYNIILVIGILRGGGDTRFSLFLELSSVWLYGVPMVFIGAHLWKLPIYQVVALVSCEEIIKSVVGFGRVASKKWVKRVIEYN